MLLMSHQVTAHCASPQEIANKAFGSVVLLLMKDQHGQPVSLGSGFVIAQNIIVTNHGAARGTPRGPLPLPRDIKVAQAQDIAEVRDPNWKWPLIFRRSEGTILLTTRRSRKPSRGRL